MKCSITPTAAATMLRKYVQKQSQETIIPCIKTILHMIYLLIFMLWYNMPFQLCRPPGDRNTAKSIFAMRKKGWYSLLRPLEQKILESPDIELSYFLIPEDSINGVYPFTNIDHSKISFIDIQNSKMHRDGTMKNTQFQFMIMKFQTKYAVPK